MIAASLDSRYRLSRLLRDQVFPALQATDPGLAHIDSLRLLLWIAAHKIGEAKGLLPPAFSPELVAWRTPASDIGQSPAVGDALAMLDCLDWDGVDARLLGDLYADLGEDRHASGRHFTPGALARWVVGWVLPSPPVPLSRRERGSQAAMEVSVLDPAMGCGHFLIAAAEQLAGEGADADRRWEALQGLHGAECDPIALEVAGIALWLWAGKQGTTPAMLGERLRCGDTLRDDLWPDHPGGFDAVIGNPPYASVFTRARLAEAGGDLADRYESAAGSYDLAVPFVERSLRLARIGGRCGLVLPNKLLAADYARTLRDWIAGHAAVEVIADATGVGAFSADVYPVVCIFRRGEAPEDRPLDVYAVATHPTPSLALSHSGGGNGRIIRKGRQKDLRCAPGAVWSAALDPAFDALRVCWEGNVRPLGEVAVIHAGLTVGEAYALRESVFDAPPNWLPEGFYQLVTTGLIRRYGSAWGKTRATYLRRTFRRPLIAGHALPPRRREQAGQAKIVVAGLGLEPRALVDRGAIQASVATVILVGAAWPLDALCALINSSLMARLYRALFGGLALRGGYLRFGKRELSLLPIPAVPGDDPRVARLEALGRLAAQGDERPDSINTLVCDLYGVNQAVLAVPGPQWNGADG